jgi:hypothetical protein
LLALGWLLAFLPSIIFQSVSVEFTVEGAAADAEAFGRTGAVAVAFAKGADDQFAFVGVDIQ